MANVTDMEKLTSHNVHPEEMKAWDTHQNCVHVVYSLEKQ